MKDISIPILSQRILKGDRAALGRGITLVESTNRAHQTIAATLIDTLIPHTGKSIRIGISGVPGVGKSTMIEALGKYLISMGHKVAVLAVDPTSQITGGSILGDKTRMEELTKSAQAFIRPSPAGTQLGGVSRYTHHAILLCEAAGYDYIIVETVGVGQSEVAVRELTDIFLLLMLTGSGDELQGIKRGIIELCDIMIINKADGDNEPKAKLMRSEYARALHLLPAKYDYWKVPILLASATEHKGIDNIYAGIKNFITLQKEHEAFYALRRWQQYKIFEGLLHDHIISSYYAAGDNKSQIEKVRAMIEQDDISPIGAIKAIIEGNIKLK